MFGTPGKVPGSAALLRAAETGRANPGRTQSRSTTPDSIHSDDASDEHDGGKKLWRHCYWLAAAAAAAAVGQSVEQSANDLKFKGSSLAAAVTGREWQK
jgi:hypothetical protein